MSEWRGSDNRDRHGPMVPPDDVWAWCWRCSMSCTQDNECRCCLKAQVQRVRELHRPCSDPYLHDGGHCCLECSDYGRQGVVRMYPCPTIRALDGE